MAEALYVSNDNLLEVDGLKNAAAGTYINDATVTATLVDEDGNNVTDAVNLSMSYVADSNGKYRATLKDSLSLTANKKYTAQITADGGTDLQGYWEFPLWSAARTS